MQAVPLRPLGLIEPRREVRYRARVSDNCEGNYRTWEAFASQHPSRCRACDQPADLERCDFCTYRERAGCDK